MDLKEIRKLFNKDLKLKSAFRAVKIDMDLLGEKNDALKQSTNDWIVFLHRENQELKQRVEDLEKKSRLLENAVDHKRLSMLREL
jgi:hypothetical protein